MKKLLLIGAAVFSGSAAYAQAAIDAYPLSQPDLKGTARYMSMGGAFGALGGDLSTLSHNPAGIGVYRNSEIGFTVDLDLQSTDAVSDGMKTTIDQTKFLLNNIGMVWTMKLPSSSCPNLNFGFTYNKSSSFNRRYRGAINLKNSYSNYLANVTTQEGYTVGMLIGDNNNDFNPYNPPDPSKAAGWASILGYDGYLFSSQPLSPNIPNYKGQWKSGTSGMGYFDVQESGTVNSFNIAFGGNISDVVFWGMDFDITHLGYTITPQWQESLMNSRVENNSGELEANKPMDSSWILSNYYNCTGTGFNYKFGLIFKPIQEFRLGFAFETPTWYSFTESFYGDLDFQYGLLYDDEGMPLGSNDIQIERVGYVTTNDGYIGTNNVNFRTPWKINASAAAVLFNRLIVSGEYEWTQYTKMKYSPYSGGYGGWYDDPWDDPWYPWYKGGTRGYSYDPFISNEPYGYTNSEITDIYSNTNTLSVGAEFRVTPQFSLRAGYRWVSSPVKASMNNEVISTAGTIPSYRMDKTTNYITCGLGYKIQNFYVDLAYVYKKLDSEFHAYSPYYPPNDNPWKLQAIESPTSSLTFNQSQIVLSAGFKF